MSLKAKGTKAKINKWGLIKPEIFYTVKETINNKKRQLTEQNKIFANDMTNKGLMSKICKQLIQLNIKKKFFLMGKDMDRYFFKEDIEMANRHVKDALHNQSSENCKSRPG